MKIFSAWGLLVLCVGCVPATSVHMISAPFDSSLAERMLAPGQNSINGSARIRFSDGGVATCFGGQVVLIPATQYAKERMNSVFGGKEISFFPSSRVSSNMRFEPDDPDFSRLTELSSCDTEGNFEFSQVADGDFIVLTTISWMVGEAVNSASFTRQLHLENGANESIKIVHDMYRAPLEPRWFERY